MRPRHVRTNDALTTGAITDDAPTGNDGARGRGSGRHRRPRIDLGEPLHPMIVAAPYVVATVLVAVATRVLRRASRP